MTTYAASGGGATARLWSPVELKVLTGYRVGGGGKSAADRMLAADIQLGVDVGRVTRDELEVGSRTYSGDVDSPILHVVIGVGLAAHFSL